MEKILEYLPIEVEQIKSLGIFAIILLIFMFLYFEKTIEYFKTNIIIWDNVTFLRYTFLMIIPIISIFSLEINLNNEILSNWLHCILLLFIFPIIPYTFLLGYRLLYLLIYFLALQIKKLISHLFKKQENLEELS